MLFLFRFDEIKSVLNGEKLDEEVNEVEDTFPDIFDVGTTQFDISILQDEIEMLMEEEKNLDNLITMNEYVLFKNLK